MNLSRTTDTPEIPATKEPIYYFGIQPDRDLKESIHITASFLRYLSQETGYPFRIRLIPSHTALARSLGKGTVHFTQLGGVAYILGKARYPIQCLAQGINQEGPTGNRAVIFTRPDSRLRRLDDLRGHSFIFTSKRSPQGYLIPLYLLGKVNIRLQDLSAVAFAGSHLQAVEAVVKGQYAAGAVKDTLANEMAAAGLIRIIATSDYYPSTAFCVNNKVPPAVIARVQTALLKFSPGEEHRSLLYNWDKTDMTHGFLKAADDDYHALRRMLR